MFNLAEAKIIESLQKNKVKYDSWKSLYNYCFTTNNVKVIDSIINAKVICVTIFEKNEYELSLNTLKEYKTKILSEDNKKYHK